MSGNKEITIEAIESHENCKGCIFLGQCHSHDFELASKLGLIDCNEGYIYKIKEK